MKRLAVAGQLLSAEMSLKFNLGSRWNWKRQTVNGGRVLSTRMLRPMRNLGTRSAMRYTEDVEQFREGVADPLALAPTRP